MAPRRPLYATVHLYISHSCFKSPLDVYQPACAFDRVDSIHQMQVLEKGPKECHLSRRLIRLFGRSLRHSFRATSWSYIKDREVTFMMHAGNRERLCPPIIGAAQCCRRCHKPAVYPRNLPDGTAVSRGRTSLAVTLPEPPHACARELEEPQITHRSTRPSYRNRPGPLVTKVYSLLFTFLMA